MRLFTFILLASLFTIKTFPQEPSQSITMKEAEESFLACNLSLLAEKYNISLIQAQVIQAKLFENPIISLEQNIYNRINKKYFDFGKDGQSAIEIEQVINLAGQRNKRVQFERYNEKIAQYQFEELIRTLRCELKTTFTQLYFYQKNLGIYDKGIYSLDQFAQVLKKQQAKQNVSLMELSRLEGLLLSLHKERKETEDLIIELQGKLNILLNSNDYKIYYPLLNEDILKDLQLTELSIPQLSEIQQDARPDLQIASTEILSARANLKLQNSLSAPEFAVKGIYDKAGNFINDYFAIGVSLSVPIFNRNQGNIKAAKLRISQSQIQQEQKCKKAASELQSSYRQLETSLTLYRNYPQTLENNFEILLQGIFMNYQKRNISITEFIDYYQSYKETLLQINELKLNLFSDIEQLNYTVGQTIINY